MIWDAHTETGSDPSFYYNPGNNDPSLGHHILAQLDLAIDHAEEGSPAKEELGKRYEYIDRAVTHMRRSEGNHKWWDWYPPESSLSLLNLTSPCNTTLLGPQGSNCSRLLQSN